MRLDYLYSTIHPYRNYYIYNVDGSISYYD